MSVHCGYVGLVGLPNVGKSSFLNNILKENLSIVSAKPQTTRQAFTGVYTDKEKQIVFLDAPGYVEPKTGLFEFLSGEFERVLRDADHMMLVIGNDQKESTSYEEMFAKIEKSGKPWSLIVTKVDLPISDFVQRLVGQLDPKKQKIFGINNKKPDHNRIQNLLQDTAKIFPTQSDYFYSPDEISPWHLRDLAGEWLREACFEKLEQEIPYGLAVRIVSFKEDGKMIRIDGTIIVDKDNHKSIVIGKGGEMLKAIGQRARKKMESIFGQKVFLQTHVALRKNWQKNETHMKEFGYVRKS